MDHRITHALVEVLRGGSPDVRITHGLVEVLRGGDPKVTITHGLVEVLRDSGFTTTTSTTVTTTTTIPIAQVQKGLGFAVLTIPDGAVARKALGYVALEATTTTSTTTSTTVCGSVCWGQDSGVEEEHIRDFSGKWEGTAQIFGSGDSEGLNFQDGESEQLMTPWNTGTKRVVARINKYNIGDNVTIYYKTGATAGATVAKSWKKYSTPFNSLGFVDVRLFRGSTTTTTSTTT